MAIKRKAITISINGAEYIELDVRSREAGLTLPAVLIDGALGVDFRSDERFHQSASIPMSLSGP